MKQNIVFRSSKWFRSAHRLEISKTRFSGRSLSHSFAWPSLS